MASGPTVLWRFVLSLSYVMCDDFLASSGTDIATLLALAPWADRGVRKPLGVQNSCGDADLGARGAKPGDGHRRQRTPRSELS